MIKGFIKGQKELIIKQKYSSVGSNPFNLIAYRDPCLFLAKDFKIFTDPNDEDSQIFVNKDFKFSSIDVLYTSEDFANETVGSSIQIIKEQYKNIDLYITYYWIGDYLSSEMMNRFDRGLDQMINSIVTDNDGNVVVDSSGNVVARGENYPGYREEL